MKRERKVGDVKGLLKRDKDALSHYTTSYEILKVLVKSDPAAADWSHDFALTLRGLASVHEKREEITTARDYYDESSKILKTLIETDHTNVVWASDRALVLKGVASVYNKIGQRQPATEANAEIEKIVSNLLDEAPEYKIWQHNFKEEIGRRVEAQARSP